MRTKNRTKTAKGKEIESEKEIVEEPICTVKATMDRDGSVGLCKLFRGIEAIGHGHTPEEAADLCARALARILANQDRLPGMVEKAKEASKP